MVDVGISLRSLIRTESGYWQYSTKSKYMEMDISGAPLEGNKNRVSHFLVGDPEITTHAYHILFMRSFREK